MIAPRPALLLLAVVAACHSAERVIAKHEESSRGDTIVATRLLQPMGLETPHGQLTVALTSVFAEKLLRASLQPNVLNLSVIGAGRVWKQEVSKLGFTFDNGAWLDTGSIALAMETEALTMQGERILLQAHVEGHGQFAARLKLFGVGLERRIDVVSRWQDTLPLQIEHGETGWLMRAVGAPLKLHVELQLPAVTIAGRDFFATTFTRDVEIPVEQVKPFPLPPPAPRTVKVGTHEMSLGLRNLALGTRDGVVWLGADLVAQPVDVPKLPENVANPARPPPSGS
jgi:hypothetical protein